MPVCTRALLRLLLPFAACRRNEPGVDQDIRLSSANGHIAIAGASGEASDRLPKLMVRELKEAADTSEVQEVWKQSQELKEAAGVSKVHEMRKQSQAVRKEVEQSKKSNNHINSANVLNQVGTAKVNNVLVDEFNVIATIDWSGDVGSQIYRQSFALLGTAVSMVPGLQLVGIAVTVLGGMFGLDSQADPNTALLEAIFKQTEMQIHGALSEWSNQDKKTDLSGIVSLLKHNKSDDDWGDIVTALILFAPKLFNSTCWYTQPECEDFRTNFGGAEAMMLELSTMRVTSSVYASLFVQDECQDADDCTHNANRLARELGKWTNLLYGHFQDWQAHRMQEKWFSNGKWTYDRRRSRSFGSRRRQEFKVTPGQDLFLQGTKGPTFSGDYCGPPRNSRTYDVKYGRRRQDNIRDGIISDLDRCRAGWKDKVEGEVREIREQVNTVLRGAVHIVNSANTSSTGYLKRTSRSISCGQPPQSTCKSVATKLLAGLAPRRDFISGCWSHVPKGCLVATSIDWVILFNTCSGNHWTGKYSAVCTEPVAGGPVLWRPIKTREPCGQPLSVWECGIAAAEALAHPSFNGRTPGRSMNSGCWGHVPPGCTLNPQDLAVHYNICSGNNHTWYAVCSHSGTPGGSRRRGFRRRL